MNAGGALSSRPVENIFWPNGSSPTGEFVVRVHHFRLRAARTVPVTVIIKADGEERLFNVNCVYGLPPQEVFRFQKRDP